VIIAYVSPDKEISYVISSWSFKTVEKIKVLKRRVVLNYNENCELGYSSNIQETEYLR